jgi:hypothetical protein
MGHLTDSHTPAGKASEPCPLSTCAPRFYNPIYLSLGMLHVVHLTPASYMSFDVNSKFGYQRHASMYRCMYIRMQMCMYHVYTTPPRHTHTQRRRPPTTCHQSDNGTPWSLFFFVVYAFGCSVSSLTWYNYPSPLPPKICASSHFRDHDAFSFVPHRDPPPRECRVSSGGPTRHMPLPWA